MALLLVKISIDQLLHLVHVERHWWKRLFQSEACSTYSSIVVRWRRSVRHPLGLSSIGSRFLIPSVVCVGNSVVAISEAMLPQFLQRGEHLLSRTRLQVLVSP